MKTINVIALFVSAVALIVTALAFTPSNHQSNTAPVDVPDTVYITPTKEVINEVIGTLYHAVEAQCDDSPLITADNSFIDLKILKKGQLKWVALSRDLIARWGGPYNYGDTLYVHHPDKKIRGKWIVRDSMNARFKKRIDFLVDQKRIFPHKTKHILIANYDFYSTREEN